MKEEEIPGIELLKEQLRVIDEMILKNEQLQTTTRGFIDLSTLNFVPIAAPKLPEAVYQYKKYLERILNTNNFFTNLKNKP